MSPSHIPISQLHVSFRFSSFFFHNPLSPFSTYGHGHGASQCHGKLSSGNILKREWFSLSQHLSSANSFSWGVGRGEHTAHPHILEFWLVWPCAVAMSCPEGGIAEHLSPSSSSYSFTIPGPWSWEEVLISVLFSALNGFHVSALTKVTGERIFFGRGWKQPMSRSINVNISGGSLATWL